MTADPPIPNDARCLRCGYALRDLPAARCPECGQPFDPAQPQSMRPSPPPPPPPAPPAGPVFAWAATALVVSCLLGLPFVSEDDAYRFPIVVAAGFGVAAVVRRSAEPPGPRRRFAWVPLVAVPLAVTAALTVRVHRCVHGTLAGACGVGLAHSELGGPCHSGVRGSRYRHLLGDWYVWWE